MRRPRVTLRLRVAAGFALLGLAVSLLLGGWLYLASRDLEQRLIDEALDAELQDYLARLARNPRSLPPETATVRGYLSRPGDSSPNVAQSLPGMLRGLKPGRHTLAIAGASFRVAVHRGPDATLYMLHSRAQIAHREQRFALLLVLGMALTILLSAAGGWWLAGRVTAPVRALAERVRGRDPFSPPPEDEPPLPADEVGALARTIEGYLCRLRAFLQRERTFLRSASHELRTPLAVIQGAVEVLEADASLPAPTRERIGRIARAARGMADLTTALLALAREGQSQPNPPRPCAVDQVLAESVELHRPLLRHKPVGLVLRIKAHPQLEVAPSLLAIAIGNLLRNACTYTEQGQIDVTLTECEVRVEDTGPGIAAEELEGLLGMDPDWRRTVRGEGIGLPLVKRIADAQGWRVLVESRASGGARFRLQFAP